MAQLRLRSLQAECQNNLRGFHQALATYSSNRNGFYPKVEEDPPRNVAGVFVPILQDAGTLRQDVNVSCPANGRRASGYPSLKDLEGLAEAERQQFLRQTVGSQNVIKAGVICRTATPYPLSRKVRAISIDDL